MKVEICKGDLVVRLPDELIASLRLEAGDEIELRVAGPGRIEVARIAAREPLASFEEWSDSDDDDAFRNL